MYFGFIDLSLENLFFDGGGDIGGADLQVLFYLISLLPK